MGPLADAVRTGVRDSPVAGARLLMVSFCSLLGIAERDVIKRQPSGQVALDPEALWGQDGAVRPVLGLTVVWPG